MTFRVHTYDCPHAAPAAVVPLRHDLLRTPPSASASQMLSRASPRVASLREATSRNASTTSASPAARPRPRLASARRAPQPLAATKQSGSGATQRYSYGAVDVTMPLATVQQLPDVAQGAVVASIFAALGVGTWASCTFVGPAIADAAPGFFAFSRATWPLLGATFVAAGVAHFTAHDSFCTMMPKQCVPAPP